MFTCPYEQYFLSSARQYEDPSYIRILHASPNTKAVDVYINNRPVFRNIYYRGFSTYVPMKAGNYNIKVYPAGHRINPLINTNVTISQNSIRTIAVTGTEPNLTLFAVPEPKFSRVPGRAYVRLVHLSPNTSTVDLNLATVGKIYDNVDYKEITDYMAVTPGVHTFDVYSSDSGKRILHVPNIRLRGNKIYSLYLVGLEGKTPPLQMLIPLDGNTYLRTF